jgi:hypothetical protein
MCHAAMRDTAALLILHVAVGVELPTSHGLALISSTLFLDCW